MTWYPNSGAWITATIAQNAATTGEIDLLTNCDFIDVILPTLDSCTVAVTVSDTPGGTFVGLGTSSPTTITTTGGKADTFDVGGWQFIKIITSANQTTALRTIKVRGGKN